MKKLLKLVCIITFVFGFLTTARPARAEGILGEPVSLQGQQQPALQFSGCGGKTVSATKASYEQQVVDLVNQERASNGLPPLKKSGGLTSAARYHAADMVQDNYFSHDSLDWVDGKLKTVCGPFDRIATFYSGGSGENIAAGYGTPDSVMDAWMHSSGHAANILSEYSWEIGVGYYKGDNTKYKSYWVQDFGRQNGSYPLIIDREAAQTDDRNVSLYIYGDWQEMRLRNDDDSPTSWQTFRSQIDWTLNSGSGAHTVTVELRSGTKTASSSDIIYLTSDNPVLGSVPDTLQFLYSIPDQQLYPPSQAFTPQNIGNEQSISWQVASSGSFYDVNPGSGATPTSILVTPDNFNHNKPGTYLGEVTINVTDPASVEGSPHTTNITLEVVNYKVHQVFLPGIQN